MWNILVSSLLTGATCVLYDGHPLHPDAGVLWRLAGRVGVTNFGFFVQLKEVFVEGLVRVANLDDYYIFDEVRACLRGRGARRRSGT